MNNFIFYRNVILKFMTIILPIFLSTSYLVCSEEVTYYSTDLPIPQNLNAVSNSTGILLTWDRIESVNFNVYRSLDGKVYHKINVDGTLLVNKYNDTECTYPNEIDPIYNINYKVTSTKSGNESGFSDTISIQGSCTVQTSI